MKIPLFLLFAGVAMAAERPRASPEAAYEQAVRTADRSDGRGEQFCWNAAYSQKQFVQAWSVWHDPAWIEWGIKYYDHLLAERQKGPDGYLGWIGPYIYGKSMWQDSHVGDAILVGGALELAEAITHDDGLKTKSGDAVGRYITAARRDVLEKWDRRGTFRQDGPYAAYVEWDWFADPGNANWRQRNDAGHHGLTHPFNKQNDMALVALRLYRITGEKPFRDKAEKIFSYMRSRFHQVNSHWAWNYWEPFGAWDLDLTKRVPAHWVGVHPYRNYQAREVEQMAEAYHSGVVFSREDLERIVRTNLEVMWNGDREHPGFVNSDNDFPGGAEKRARLKPPAGEGLAGTLWTALADFSQTVRDLRAVAVRGSGHEVGRAYFENVVLSNPPSFARRYAVDVPALPEFPAGESKELNLAAALPASFDSGAGTWLVAHSVVPGDVEIALYSADDREKLKVLHKAAATAGSGFVLWHWDNAQSGKYRVRWSTGGGYRECYVWVR